MLIASSGGFKNRPVTGEETQEGPKRECRANLDFLATRKP